MIKSFSATEVATGSLTPGLSTMARVKALQKQLQEDFPFLFPTDDRLPLPWNFKLWQEIREHYRPTPVEVSRKVARWALGIWRTQNRQRYEQAILHYRRRVNLSGQKTAEVSPKRLEIARAVLNQTGQGNRSVLQQLAHLLSLQAKGEV
ncbi:MAG: hypothetical protein HQL72_12155 [Magnetococcales bacterium]|nr:hypothetical protein [Magnetococcales bacterium]